MLYICNKSALYMSHIISFDESGNTGQDLLNPDQKVFVLSSVNYSNEDIEVLTSLFDVDNELHFQKLKNSTKGRKQLIEFLNHRLITENNIISHVSDKEFLVTAQIVDKLIEVSLYNKGIDIYQYGKNIAITNLLYYAGKARWNKYLYREILENFIQMVRLKSDDHIDAFYSSVESLQQSVSPKERFLLDEIIESKSEINEIIETFEKFTIDVTLSSFLVICDLWYRKLGEKFSILFDNSKQISHYQGIIDFMKNFNSEVSEIGYGNRTMVFPKQIINIELVDSNDSKSVQLADLIASSIAFMYNNKNVKYSKFVQEIRESRLLNLSNCHTICPSTKVSPVELGMEDSNGINILDYLVEKLDGVSISNL